MTHFAFILIGGYSISIAVIIGLLRFPKIHRDYRPFIFIIIASLISEVISSILISYRTSNAIAVNLMGLADGSLWLWQFRKWKAFDTQKLYYPIAAILMITAWIVENILLGRLSSFSSLYAIGFSFSIVFLSIGQVNRQITDEKDNLLLNAKFLICSGAILFYTYRILVECFYLLDIRKSDSFLINVFNILALVNLIVNLLFAFAIIWIPTRQKFSLPYS